MNQESSAVEAADVTSAEAYSNIGWAPPSLEATTAFIDLSFLLIVDVSGKDAESFLQGQFINDIASIKAPQQAAPGSDANSDVGSAELNGYCTPKGRLLSLMTVMAHNNGVRLLMPAVLSEGLLKRLRMFVMRDDVVFTPRPDLAVFAAQGDRQQLSQLLPSGWELPEQHMQTSGGADSQTLRWFDGVSFDADKQVDVSRWMLIMPMADAEEVLQALSSTSNSSDGLISFHQADQWVLGNIFAGVADIGEQGSDAFIPQMLNLQQVGGLSFTKGCYPGQEIVARMQYLGKLKKHMAHLYLPSASRAPVPGEVLASAESDSAAEVVSVVTTEQGTHFLAVVRIGIELGKIELEGQACSVIDLPYELTQP